MACPGGTSDLPSSLRIGEPALDCQRPCASRWRSPARHWSSACRSCNAGPACRRRSSAAGATWRARAAWPHGRGQARAQSADV